MVLVCPFSDNLPLREVSVVKTYEPFVFVLLSSYNTVIDP